MSIRPGEIVGVVGESGSGKSVMSQSILRLREYDSDVRYEGQVLFEGQDLLKASQAEMRGIRGNRIAVIFQDPMTSLSPVHTVGRQLSEVLVLHKKMTKQRAKERCRELLRLTGIPNPEDCMRKYPYELSGGMQQRVMIAMALSCEPKLLIADEPTTALDVTIQEQILNLIAELNERMGMSVLFITHDLGPWPSSATASASCIWGILWKKPGQKNYSPGPCTHIPRACWTASPVWIQTAASSCT